MINVYWLRQNESDVPGNDEWLSDNEVIRLSGLRFAKRRSDWRLGRWVGKCAVAAYLKLPFSAEALATIEIRSTASWAPEVWLHGRPAAVTISLSHRGGQGMCAVAPPATALGCDLEVIEPHSESFVEDYFTIQEQQLMEQAAVSQRSQLVALLWSAKESALKALGVGLQADVRSFAVTYQTEKGRQTGPGLTDGDIAGSAAEAPIQNWRTLQVCNPDSRVFRGWWLCSGTFITTVVADPSPFPPVALLRKAAEQSRDPATQL